MQYARLTGLFLMAIFEQELANVTRYFYARLPIEKEAGPIDPAPVLFAAVLQWFPN